ncbi:MarR family winged helix-turn-helix transcriptional regulator [Brachybacterium sp. NBEC-018]|uniref:MarR family winged helix-turn-helix transcriptional regulator n=1 Tax=Brachybacterium sp. NBEC-018 TaxID=2996004 RepID=UPI002174E1CA|nr:MarR family winged helix-turn-helix transcriptional regulator [Brachybacterium sp. NBEC-018]UVY84947.1 MarR family winged helix-turn-helix transcriptional regulator [Brachybacterium sp. NBEC-018]
MGTRKSVATGAGVERGRRLAGMYALLERHRRHHQQSMELGTADLRILWLLSDGDPRTLKEIAQQLSLEQSTVNRQVNAAVVAGRLEKVRPEEGGPYRVLRTDAGTEVFERDVQLSLGAYEEALAALGDEDAEQLLTLMDRFLEAYGDLAGERS